MRINRAHILIGTYVLVAFVLIPMMTPMRQLGTATPGAFRAAMIPPIIILTTLELAPRMMKINNFLMPILIAVFILAAIVGIGNAAEFGSRNYLSHLFQIFSAYVMLVAGMSWATMFGLRFWKRFSWLALVAVSISTAFSISYWADEEIGRLYTPAYVLIFVTAVSLSIRPNGGAQTLASVLVAAVSNKRGPLLSVLLMVGSYSAGQFGLLAIRKTKLSVSSIYGLFLKLFTVSVATLFLLQLLSGQVDNAIVQAFNKTTERLMFLVASSQGQSDFNAATAGRIEEVDLALNSLHGLEFVLGNGAGWTEQTAFGKEIQNIHFTPLSVATVFGFPFSIFLYSYIVWLILSMSKWCMVHGTQTEKLALFYLIGSIAHTLAAYSLFVDLLNFFFIGVLIKSRERRKADRIQLAEKDL